MQIKGEKKTIRPVCKCLLLFFSYIRLIFLFEKMNFLRTFMISIG